MRFPFPALVVLLFAAVGCDERIPRIEIAPYQHPCSGYEGQTRCLMTRSVGSDAGYMYDYDGFRGFTHRWGYTSVLEYSTAPVPPPVPADSPNVIRQTLRVVEEHVVADGTPFSIVSFDRPPGNLPDIELTGPTTGRLLQEPNFTCGSEALCSELEGLIGGGYRARLDFAFVVDPEVRLVLTGIVPLE